jgi:hypothetical protein
VDRLLAFLADALREARDLACDAAFVLCVALLLLR